MTIAVDTSVVIAGLLSWHEFHHRAFNALERAMVERQLVMPMPTLIESYSVMTRLPSAHRLSPAVAHEILRESFAGVPVAALAGTKVWDFLGTCAAEPIAGGRVYDALIASAAIAAKVDELLTFSPRDFDSFAGRIAIVVP